MNGPEPDTGSAARRRVWTLLGYATLILAPLFLALLVSGTKFRGLRTTVALEHAESARRLAAGEGFTTGSLRPLSLAFVPDGPRHPDLYHAPAHPLLLALAYALFHPSDRVTAAAGAVLWVASLYLTFFLARRWFGPRPAALAVLLCGLNVALLKSALIGLPYALSALFVLAVAGLAVPSFRGQLPPEEIPGWRVAGAGFFSALAAMTHFPLFFLAPAVASHVVTRQSRKGRAILLFAAGFLVVLSPWIWRNVRWTGSPLFSLYWYEALTNTEAYPGDSVWRTSAAASMGPLEFLVREPFQVARRFLGGLARFWEEGLHVVDPVVGFLFLVALLGGRTDPSWRRWLIATAAAGVLCSGASCLLRPEPEILLAGAPLLAIAAAAFLSDWLPDLAVRISLRRAWESRSFRRIFVHPDRARAAIRLGLGAAIVGAAAFPLFHFLWVARPEPAPVPPEAVAALRRYLPREAAVLTDQPAMVAWYAERRALWLFLDEKDWDTLERCAGPIEASWVTPHLVSFAPRETGNWWWWIASPRGVYRNLALVEQGSAVGVLRVRR